MVIEAVRRPSEQGRDLGDVGVAGPGEEVEDLLAQGRGEDPELSGLGNRSFGSRRHDVEATPSG